MFRVLPKHCASSMAKEPEKLHYKTIWMPFVYRTCNISRHILKMCNLPSFLYSFHSKEVITVKCWGARGKQRLAGACRNLLWTLMKNISTLFITKSTGHRWSKAHKLRYDGTPQGTIRERERLCTRVHACVCVCVCYFSFILAVRKIVIEWQKLFCALRKVMVHGSYSQNEEKNAH